MANINELELVDEAIPEVNLDEMPTEGFDLPQPGTALFKLPDNLLDLWDTVATQKGQRVKANFKKNGTGDFRLLYSRNGETGKLSISLSNVEMGARPSKLHYLLAALGNKGVVNSNKELVDALAKESGRMFLADITWTARSRNTGQRYSTRPYTNKKTGVEVKDIPRDHNGKYLMEFVDDGELIRSWPDLEKFRPAR